jgi:hypothetical protein
MSHTPNDQWLLSGKQAKDISGLLSGYKVQAKIDKILESLPAASLILHHQAQITADDVTDEMVDNFNSQFTNGSGMTDKEIIAAAVNAYMGSKK